MGIQRHRTLTLPTMEEGDVVVYELAEAAFPLPAVRVAGTLVPLFSLRSQTASVLATLAT